MQTVTLPREVFESLLRVSFALIRLEGTEAGDHPLIQEAIQQAKALRDMAVAYRKAVNAGEQRDGLQRNGFWEAPTIEELAQIQGGQTDDGCDGDLGS